MLQNLNCNKAKKLNLNCQFHNMINVAIHPCSASRSYSTRFVLQNSLEMIRTIGRIKIEKRYSNLLGHGCNPRRDKLKPIFCFSDQLEQLYLLLTCFNWPFVQTTPVSVTTN